MKAPTIGKNISSLISEMSEGSRKLSDGSCSICIQVQTETKSALLAYPSADQTGNAVFRTHCPHENDSAPAPLGEFRAKMVGDV